ncbi:MAG: histidine--tRNA ligase [bacterium]
MIKAIRGVKDILPQEVGIWQYVEAIGRKMLQDYGFSELRIPVFEDTALFIRSIGEETDIVSKEMYTFPDRKGNSLSLRPEGTAPVVRAFVEHRMYAESPYQKLYYQGPMFRYERPQAGRTRQFHQIGAEVFGLAEPGVDAEMLILLNDLFSKLGLAGVTLFLNSVGCPENCRPQYKKILQEFIRKDFESLCPDCQTRYEKNPLRIMDCKNEACQAILAQAPVILEHLCPDCRKHHEEVERLLKLADIPYRINHRLVRGLDYYTRTAFEVTASGLGAQNAIAGGGRYDRLVEEFGGPPTPAIGFALGMERVIMALQGQGIAPQPQPLIYLAALGQKAREEAFLLIRTLRSRGLRVIMNYQDRSLKALLKQADQMGARLTLILGENELASRLLLLRDMTRSVQEEIALDSDIAAVLEAKVLG